VRGGGGRRGRRRECYQKNNFIFLNYEFTHRRNNTIAITADAVIARL
jgi:hypothetical protein